MAKKVLIATVLALLLGVSATAAQTGGEARSNDREMEKALDNRELTPIRPIRRVGEDSWPAGKNRPAAVETTGQAPKDAATESSGNRETVKQDGAKQDTPQQEPAQQETATQPPQQPGQQAQPSSVQHDDKSQDRPQDKAQDKQDFASIRLGTDKNGRVAINDAQKRQISSALRKQRIQTVDVAVMIGAAAPASVRLGAVSADIVAVLPQFRGYSYFATREDEDIVIVDPDTKKIVARVPVTLTATAAKPQPERGVTHRTDRGATQSTTTRTSTKQPSSSTTVTRRETTGSGMPTEEEILASPVVTAPGGTTVTRTYRAAPTETVIIEHHRRPRIFGLW